MQSLFQQPAVRGMGPGVRRDDSGIRGCAADKKLQLRPINSAPSQFSTFTAKFSADANATQQA